MKTATGIWAAGLGALLAVAAARAGTVRVAGGEWRMRQCHVASTQILVGSGATLGGSGTVNAPTEVAGTVSPEGTLAFGFSVVFTNGALGIHATDSATLDRIEASGAVTGTATVRMTRAEAAFPTQQVVVAGSAASDYAAFLVAPSTNWTKGTSGALDMWVTYRDGSSVVVLYDFYLQEVGGKVCACWRTASEEDTVGFDLFRWNGEDWVKVNSALIPGSGEMGGSYCVADAEANATDTFRYKLVEIETDGGVQEYGPFEMAASNPRLENLSIAPGGVVLRWLSREGDVYGVQKATDVRSGFAPLATGLPATPPVNVYTDATETVSGAYYRVRVEQLGAEFETGPPIKR